MYLEFYNLREQPFGDTPNPRFLHKTETHARALSSLFRHTDQGERLQTIIAQPGTGKTTLLFALFDHLSDRTRLAFLTNTLVNPAEFMGFLVRTFALEDKTPTLDARRLLFIRFLQEQARAGHRVLTVVDEAHNLSNSVLQEIRYLVERAPASLQVILSAQPQLKATLRAPSVSALLSAIPHELRPLEARDIAGYVQHRLAVAGYSGPELFTSDAINAVLRESGGIPRIINNICFQSLLIGAAAGKRSIGAGIISDAVKRYGSAQLPLTPVPAPQPRIPPAQTFTARVPALSKSSAPMQSTIKPDLRAGSPAPPPLSSASDSARLAALLRGWLERSTEMWTGTASELTEVLRSIPGETAPFASLPPRDLYDLLDRSASDLRSCDVKVEIRTRPGSPRLISLHLREGGTTEASVPPQPTPERKQPVSESAPASPAQDTASATISKADATEPGSKVASTTPNTTLVDAETPDSAEVLVAFGSPAPPETAPEPPAIPATLLDSAPLFSSVLTENTVYALDGESATDGLRARLRRINPVVAGVVVATLLIVAVLVYYASRDSRRASATGTQVVQAATAASPAPSAAIAQLKSDAESGDSVAQYALALRFASGDGVPHDHDEALRWLRRAAKQGHSQAQFELGNELVRRGDPVAAYPWLVLANSAGVADSADALNSLAHKLTGRQIAAIRYQLGDMFYNGVGVRRNYVAAYTWFHLAQAAGEKHAPARKSELQARMTPSEVDEAIRRADTWLQPHQR